MNMHFEPISGNLRLFVNGEYGDRYDWSCRVDVIDSVAYLSLVRSMVPGVRCALLKWGQDQNISEFRWTRIKSGQKCIRRCDVLYKFKKPPYLTGKNGFS
ncbi:MAG: hypothetical protein JKY45_13435 [Emcibacter sp.]|nr:hypothetical protein [Emcibacter sp.]